MQIYPQQSNQYQINKNNKVTIHDTTKTFTFSSLDGLIITADIYAIKNPKNYILLCHQAGYSRGEYLETAKKLNKLGYYCMAIDQRSGNEVNGVINQTNLAAKHAKLHTNYLDAKQDIIASINKLYKIDGKHPIILVGSSYSAALVLLIATHNKKVKAVASFSPGEYLNGIILSELIAHLDKPTFVTSAKSEINQTSLIVKNMNQQFVTQFKPSVKGFHGSKALWSTKAGNKYYWVAFSSFLKGIDNLK